MKVPRAFSRHTSRRLDRRVSFVCSLFVVASAACGGSTSTSTATISGPTAARCSVTLRPSATTFGYTGGSGQIDIDTARECEWKASSDAPWISLKPASGQGTGTSQFSVAPNDQPTRRAAGILINDHRVDLSEDAAPCRVQLAPPRATLGFDGGDAAISIATLNGCRWTATTTTPWIELRDPVSGNGNGEVRFRVEPNSGAQRVGTIRVAESEQQIVQQAAPGPSNPPAPPAPAPAPPPPAPSPAPPPPTPSPVPPPPSCALELDPVSGDAAAAGGDGRIRVHAPDACSWTAVSESSWMTIAAGAAGKGDGEVRYRVSPNTDQQRRSGSLAIGDRTFIVRQEAAAPLPPPSPPSPPPPPCSFRVDPGSEKFDADGGEDRIRVRTTDACSWTAATQSGWITITAGAAGKGNGEVRYLVAENAGAARDGALSVADRTIRIRQEGASERKVKIEGQIGSLKGACPKLTFSIDGTAVQTTADTRYDDGSCGSLRNGMKVEVKGLQPSKGAVVLALEVKVRDKELSAAAPQPNPWQPPDAGGLRPGRTSCSRPSW